MTNEMEDMTNGSGAVSFPDNWITTGFSRGPDGKWIELGHLAGITIEGGAKVPPQLGLHDVADKLNELEDIDTKFNKLFERLSFEHKMLHEDIVGCRVGGRE